MALVLSQLQVQTFCISPNGQLLLSIDEDGRSLLINWERRTLLHHFTFKQPVAAAKFSPDGRYIACAVGRLLQVLLPGHGLISCPDTLTTPFGTKAIVALILF
jgi:periodic tryptophan protein 2